MTSSENTPEKAAAPQKEHKIELPYYPIVYVRGYAMSSDERDETFHDGYYGFAATSVRKRQGPPDPDRYLIPDVFEGQLMRFVKDFGYADAINRGNRIQRPPRQSVFNPSRSLWISRFYDTDVMGQKLRSITDHAADLLTLIRDVIPAELRECGMDEDDIRQNYRVILLAHSMGGLVCRTVLQNMMPADGMDPKQWVHRLVTMGTPHGGIVLDNVGLGVQQFVMNTFNPDDASMFGEKMMRQYLKIPPGDAINSLGDKFPVDRCLCLIGSDYKDYGIVRRATGGVSDGLVLQRNAYCAEGPAPAPGTEYAPDKVAFSANVHKAHSGYEGIVNSYESWENIHRFLFGDVRASIGLAELGLATPEPTTANERVYYDIEFMFSVRGTNTPMHWRAQMPCENALRREREDMFQATIGLHTAFLNTALRLEIPAGADPSEGVNVRDSDGTTRRVSRYLYFKMNLRVVEYRAREAGGALTFIKQHLGIDSHYDGTQVYGEGLEVRVDAETYDVQYRWFSEPNPDPVAMSPWQVVTDKTPTSDGMKYRFDLRQGGALTGKFVIQAQKWQPDLWQKVALAAG